MKAGTSPPTRVSCFVSATGGLSELTAFAASKFSGAAVNVVQTLRAPLRTEATCEAVFRSTALKAERLAFSGTRISLGADEKAAATTFQRLDKDLADAGAAQGSIVAMRIYPVTARVGEMARSVRGESGAMTVVAFEGVASHDAAFATDAVAEVASLK